MGPQDALQALDNTVAQVKMSREDHFTAMQAVNVLQNTIHENQQLRAAETERQTAERDAPAVDGDDGAADEPRNETDEK